MKILDYGSVELVEAWGSDENIIRAARQSTDGAFRGWETKCRDCGGSGQVKCQYPAYCDRCRGTGFLEGDSKLLKYLYTHRHMTPFEMCGAIFEIKAPIFVFREWHRHRTQSYNEMSARYIPLPDENYIPSLERIQQTDTKNKQAQGSKEVSDFDAHDFQLRLKTAYEDAEYQYQHALKAGIPKELARLVVPVGRYSKMWASANLRNWMQFLELRNAPNAQWEIQEYARAVQSLLKETFPRTIELFEEER